jgi:uncharacterized protein
MLSRGPALRSLTRWESPTASTRSRRASTIPVASEQYYTHTDRNNIVLAEITFGSEHFSWLDGLCSPVARVRTWGKGRVFYHSIGYTPEDLEGADFRRLTKQGIAWATGGGRPA